ncbi:MAG TPA: YggT family protein [Solirubrobacteraceae bacterium]|nr:YggT family protein [Solirubrobacteraceae bacterium]
MILASARSQIADYVSALIWVYTLIIFVYVLSQLFFGALGGRIPYARWSSALLGFLHDVSEPYLRLFRRIVPPLGPVDLSPMVAILVLVIVGRLVVGAIDG